MGRNVLGVIVGSLAWMFVFMFLAFGMAVLWPDYGLHGQQWFREQVFTFTPPMAVFNVVSWFIGAVAAGWVAMKISRHPGAIWVLAILIGGYLALNHLILEWPRFPWWYNLGVVLPAIPGVLLGARLARPGGVASR